MAHLYLPIVLCLVSALGGSFAFDQLESFTDSLLQEVMNKINDEGQAKFSQQVYVPHFGEYPLPADRVERKLISPSPNLEMVKEFGQRLFNTRHDDDILDSEPSIRDQEYLEHSSLFGHQYVQGGAGEGYQRLKPDGSIKNIQVVKTDGVLASYCNPPNPCPLGYSGQDGCLEEFVNTAAFSREYQASQDCMCDTEHMFDCPGTTRDSEIDTLSRYIQNEGLTDSNLGRIVGHMQIPGEHKNLVAKKFFSRKRKNPYLQGDKLPVVAKKSPKKEE